MDLAEMTMMEEKQRLLDPSINMADRRPTPNFMDAMHQEPRKMWPMSSTNRAQAPDGQISILPASHSNWYVETREPWIVWYEGDGILAKGQVLGFSEAGWHIVGEATVQAGARLTLRVHRPDRSDTFCVPSATVQGVQGRAFVIRVQIQAAS